MSLDDLLDNYSSKGGAPRLKSEFRGPAPTPAPTQPPAPAPAPAPTPAPALPTYGGGGMSDSAGQSNCESIFPISNYGSIFPIRPNPTRRVYSVKNAAPSSANGSLVLMPQRAFQPLGIALFGCGHGTTVTCNVGREIVFYDVYGRFFEGPKTAYTDLYDDWPTAISEVCMPSFPTCTLASQIVIRYIKGPLVAAVLWGHDV